MSNNEIIARITTIEFACAILRASSDPSVSVVLQRLEPILRESAKDLAGQLEADGGSDR